MLTGIITYRRSLTFDIIDKTRFNSYLSPRGNCLLAIGNPLNRIKKRNSVAKNQKYVCVADARLDDKLSLYKKLNLDPNINYDSAYLILQSYLKWDKECVSNIIGDWAFAIWDKDKEELFLARDHIGHTELFYYEGEDFFAFSTKLSHLLSLPFVNSTICGDTLIRHNCATVKDNKTFYKNIFRLLPAHYVALNQSHRKLHNYWLPIPSSPINYQDGADYVEHFLEVYTSAITDRIEEEKAGLLLSAGLDSTSILALLAPILEKNEQTIDALTWQIHPTDNIYDKNNYRLTNEVPLANSFANQFSSVDFHAVTAQKKNVVAIIKRGIDIYQQPEQDNILVHELFEYAEEIGLDSLFTGYGGNLNVSYTGDRNRYFNQLLLNGKRKEFISNAAKWKRQNNWNVLRTAYRTLFLPLFKKNSKKNGRAASLLNIIHPQAIQDNPLKPVDDLLEFNNFHVQADGAVRAYMRNMRTEVMGTMNTASMAYGIRCKTPTMDKRLIEYCLNIPEEQFLGNGQHKWLLKRAMYEKIPDEILYSKQRGLQGGNIIYKFNQEAKDILNILAIFKESKLIDYWLNLEKLEKAVNTIQDSKNYIDCFFATRILTKGLSFGFFLQKMENGDL